MVDICVVYDKLRGFETADDLAEYFKSLGIEGEVQNAASCAITRYVMMETGLETVSTNTECLMVYEVDGPGFVFNEPHTDAMADFVQGFDHGRYPDLVEASTPWWEYE